MKYWKDTFLKSFFLKPKKDKKINEPHFTSSSKSYRVQSRKPHPALSNSQCLSEPMFAYKIKGLEQNFFKVLSNSNFLWFHLKLEMDRHLHPHNKIYLWARSQNKICEWNWTWNIRWVSSELAILMLANSQDICAMLISKWKNLCENILETIRCYANVKYH